MNYLDYIPPELVVEILLYLDIDEIENLSKISTNVRDVIDTKLFWIKKLQFDNMSEYIPFLGRKGTYLEDYKEFMEIEEEIYHTKFAAWLTIRLKRDVDIKDLIEDYTPEEIADLITLKKDASEVIEIEYKGSLGYEYIIFNSKKLPNLPSTRGELSEEEAKVLLIKLRLGGVILKSIGNWVEMYDENKYI